MADNEVQIDSLSIAIEESARNTSRNLTALSTGLKKLGQSVSGLKLDGAASQLTALTSAVNGIGNNADKLMALASSLLDLKSVGRVDAAVPKSLSNQIAALGNALNGIAESDIKRLTGLSSALNYLGSVKMPSISASIGHQLSGIGDALKKLQGADFSKVSELATVLKPLVNLGRSQLTSFIHQLGKLPQLSRDLDAVDMERFASTVERLTAAMKPLAEEMDKIARGFAAFPQRIQKFIANNEKAASSVKTSKTEWNDFFNVLVNGSSRSSSGLTKLAKQLVSVATLRRTAEKIKDAIESANEYIESLNLFNVSMGRFTEEGQKYAELVGDSYGIDPAEFMKMQAVVMDMSKSFGVTSDTAYTMSKALTQLTYDISSLYNLKIDEAASKVQSALAGEIEPIRRLGKDLSVANLKLLATELGINSNVDAMNQAEKAMLRTVSLLRQSTSAMGDMARTLEQPANQFRVLKAQLELLSRALGDLFLPIVQKILPYFTAFIKVTRQVVMAFAELAGFKLPEFDYGDSVDNITEVGDAADDAAKSVKKLYLLSFDELNILGNKNSSGTGTGLSAEELAKLEAELNRLAKIEDDLFSKSLGEATDKIAENMEQWLTKGKGIKEWAKDVAGDFEKVKNFLGNAADYADEVGAMLGFWKIDDDLITKLRNVGIALLVIKGAQTAIKIGSEIAKVGTLIGKLFGLGKATDTVADAMTNKNKKLTEQTKETAKETEAVEQLAPAYDTTTTAVVDLSAAIPLVGLAWLANKSTIDSNPVSLAFDTSKVSESVFSVETSAQSILSTIENMSWNAAQMTDNLGVSLNSAAETYGNEIAATAGNTAVQMVSDMQLYGEDLYDAMVDPMQRIDAEYANIFDNIYQNYANLMNSMGASVGSSYKASAAAKITQSQRDRVVKRGKYLQSSVLDNQEYNYGAGTSNSKSTSSIAIDALGRMYKQQWDDISKKISDTGKSFASGLSTVIDKTMDMLSKLLGISSAAIGVPAFASGGFPEDGMFFANSNELVGRFANGRTAVANNEEITEGIRRAVYEAVVAAQGRSGRGGTVELILDRQVVGRTFGDAIDAEKRRSGANTKITFSNGGTR